MKTLIIRIALGAFLPVFLYVFGLCIFSLDSLLEQDETLQWVMIYFAYGYGIMGIPSIIYASIIEAQKRRKVRLNRICFTGAVIGFFSGSIFLLDEWNPYFLLSMSLPGALIGALIPLILHPIKNESEQVGVVKAEAAPSV
tara:strand:+ start:332 stop:754 length:423 start_codon:yes stop_codon:yes gene_type:complete